MPSFSKIFSNHGLYHNNFVIVNAGLQFCNSGMIFGVLSPKKFKLLKLNVKSEMLLLSLIVLSKAILYTVRQTEHSKFEIPHD